MVTFETQAEWLNYCNPNNEQYINALVDIVREYDASHAIKASATRKSAQLLANSLDLENRAELLGNRRFLVKKGAHVWLIFIRASFGLYKFYLNPIDEHEHNFAQMCAAPTNLPFYDSMLQIKEMVESENGEEIVIRNANIALFDEPTCGFVDCLANYRKLRRLVESSHLLQGPGLTMQDRRYQMYAVSATA